MMKPLSFAFALASSFAAQNPVVVDFNEACVTKESIETKEGGLLESIDIWVQGESMKYTHNEKKNALEGSGRLRVEYHGQLFVGEHITYDFHSKTGVIHGGRTHCGAFYIYGKRIYLAADGRYHIEGARLTTCESIDPAWQIKADSLTLSDDYLVHAKDVIFKLSRLPLFWLPSMRANLNTLAKSPFEYQFVWKSKGGPRLTFKYQVFSWENSSAHLRFDYRIRRGPGFGLESNYHDEAKQMSFASNSYVARDRTILNRKNKARYRVEGLFEHTSKRYNRYAKLSYDKLSDPQMPYDYPRDTFELPSAKPTRLTTYSHFDPVTFSIISQAKINRFETVKQEFPQFRIDVLPLPLFGDALLIKTPLELSFLDYRFASRWKNQLESFSTLRIYGRPQLQLNLKPGPFQLTSEISPTYLYYATGESDHHTSVRFLSTKTELSLPFTRRWPCGGHTLAPFAQHEFYSEPSRSALDHDIFDLTDAYAKIQLLNVGLKTSFAKPHAYGIDFLQARSYFQNFWDVKSQEMHFGRFCLDLSWQRPNLYAGAQAAWNRMHNLFEFANGWARWTVSDHLALNVEMRHRSKYAWRKLDQGRFFLDSAYTVDELLNSPMSDARNTAISRIAVRLSPTWRMLFQSRHCWGRADERTLNDFRIDLRHYLACNLEIGLSVTHTEANKIRGGITVSASRYPLRPKMRVKRFKPKW